MKIQLRFIIICFICLISLQSSTINKPLIISGFIDRMHPAVILLESRAEEIIIHDEELPKESEVGMWVEVEIIKGEYHITEIDKQKTERAKQQAEQLQTKLNQ